MADNQTTLPLGFSPAWILLFLSASVGVAMMGLGIVWPLVPIYAVELGASGFQVGVIIAAFNVGRTCFNPIAGRFSDRWGRKPFILLGLFLYAVVSVLYVLSARVESLVLVRLLHGFTSVLVVPVAMALTGDIAPQHRFGRYLGTLNMAIMLGFAAGPALGGVIRDYFGMPSAFYTMGALAILTFFGVAAFIPGGRHQSTSQSAQPVTPLKRLLKHRVIQGLFLLRLFVAAGQGCVYTFFPILALRMQLTSSQVGFILGANIFLIAFSQRICGDIADRVNPIYMIVMGTLISGIVVLGMPYAHGFSVMMLLNIIMGIGNGIAMPGGFVITGQLGRTMGMGSLMGFTETGWSLGMTVSPVISGMILDSLGLNSVFIAGALITIIGTALIFLFLKGYAPPSGGQRPPA
jgi:MFS family permease